MSFNIEGSLYELIARGNKDVYFIEDTKEAKNLFDNRYGPTPAHIHELRNLPPLNNPDFGRSCEFQIEMAGDVFIEPTLLIDLPSWLPPTEAELNAKAVVTDLSGVSYGYTNGIGYFLFEKIQFLQDNILLQEFSGDALWACSRTRGTLNSAFLDAKQTGIHNGSQLSIGRNTTPGRLRLQIPIVGCQSSEDGGFPAYSTPQQSYRLRCFLRRLEDLVESSDGRAKPTPWTSTLQIQTSSTTAPIQFTPLSRTAIGTPTLTLQTRHIYMDGETQQAMKNNRQEIPFERIYENRFTQSQNDYAPISRGGTAAITRRLEGVHPTSRIISFFRRAAVLQTNQLWNLSNTPTVSFYGNLKLLVAGRDRESLFSPLIWRDLVTHAKSERDPGIELAIMDWTLGDIRNRKSTRQPDGSINMTTADRPTLYIELLSTPTNTELRSIVETWATIAAENQRLTLLYAN
jgi:hypothetical protein